MEDLLNQLKEFEKSALERLSQAKSATDFENLKIELLGRKGKLNDFSKMLGKAPADLKPKLGAEINRLKKTFQETIDNGLGALGGPSKADFFDYTLPVRSSFTGNKHPLLKTLDEIISIFHGMGFEIASGPDVETEFNNFDALNTPEDHPSRDLSDTFYIKKGICLRTHTSPVQIRTMKRMQPPVRIIAPGRCYRSDTPDASHSPVFFQCEGLYVDQGVTFADLKGTITAFARAMFGPEVKVRFRPHFFPFTEPSVEYDFSCVICGGKGCRVCKHNGWLEISGAGMVDPEVFKAVGYDSEKYTGFAWGMGVDRLTMLRYRIDDVRLLYENDIRFIGQF